MDQQSGKTDGIDVIHDDNWNSIALEIENAITGSGILLSGGSFTQLFDAIGVISAGGNYFTYGGTPSAITLTTFNGTPVSSYSEGLVVEFLVPVNDTNAGAATVNVDGQGVQNIYAVPGTTVALSGGEIRGFMRLIYDGTNFVPEEPKAPMMSDARLTGLLANDTTVVNGIHLNSSDSWSFGDTSIPGILQGSTVTINVGVENVLTNSGSGTEIFANDVGEIQTVDHTVTLNLAGGEVKDTGGNYQPIGFNIMPPFTEVGAFSLTRANASGNIEYTGAGAQNATITTDANLVDGTTWSIVNNGSGDLTITPTTGTLRWPDGSTLQTGNRTLGVGGVATVTKFGTNEYRVWGNGGLT